MYSASTGSSSFPLLSECFELAVLGVAQTGVKLLGSSGIDVVSNVDSKDAKSGWGESDEERQRRGVGDRGGSGMSCDEVENGLQGHVLWVKSRCRAAIVNTR